MNRQHNVVLCYIFLLTCYFILQDCSFIAVIRVTPPIDINVQTRSLLASLLMVSFVSPAGSFFTELNVYKYEILLIRPSLLQA